MPGSEGRLRELVLVPRGRWGLGQCRHGLRVTWTASFIRSMLYSSFGSRR
jgi:hypothetical protein